MLKPDMADSNTYVEGDDVGVDDRAICYWEEDPNPKSDKRTLIVRASALGSCTRALVAAALGYEEQRYQRADEIMMQAAGEGMLHEQSVVDRLAEMDYKLTDIKQQAFTETKVIPGVIIRGHIDGWAESGPGIDEDTEAVIEVKTMSVARFKEWENHGFSKFGKYAWQLAGYMFHYIKKFEKEDTHIGAVYAVKNRNTGELVVQYIDQPPVSWEQIRGKIIEVYKWALAGELPPCDPNLESGERYFCPFVMLHDEEIAPDEDVMLTDAIGIIIEGMAREHYELGLKIKPMKALEAQRKQIAQDMKPHLTAKRTVAGDYKVVRVDSSRKGLDVGRIADELGMTVADLKEQYNKPSEFSYYRVDKIETD